MQSQVHTDINAQHDEIIALVSSQAYRPPGAGLEEKGLLISPLAVFLTTNNPYPLNTGAQVTSKGAFARRVTLVLNVTNTPTTNLIEIVHNGTGKEIPTFFTVPQLVGLLDALIHDRQQFHKSLTCANIVAVPYELPPSNSAHFTLSRVGGIVPDYNPPAPKQSLVRMRANSNTAFDTPVHLQCRSRATPSFIVELCGYIAERVREVYRRCVRDPINERLTAVQIASQDLILALSDVFNFKMQVVLIRFYKFMRLLSDTYDYMSANVKYITPTHIAIVTAFGVTLFTAIKFISKSNIFVQSAPAAPVCSTGAKSNLPVPKRPIVLRTVVVQGSGPTVNTDGISKNIVSLVVKYEGGATTGVHGLAICDRRFLFPSHAFVVDGAIPDSTIFEITTYVSRTPRSYHYTKADASFLLAAGDIPDMLLVTLNVNNMPLHANIVNAFAPQVTYLLRSTPVAIVFPDRPDLDVGKADIITNITYKYGTVAHVISVPRWSSEGSCGLPYTINGTIVGIHFAVSGSRSYGAMLSREHLSALLVPEILPTKHPASDFLPALPGPRVNSFSGGSALVPSPIMEELQGT